MYIAISEFDYFSSTNVLGIEMQNVFELLHLMTPEKSMGTN